MQTHLGLRSAAEQCWRSVVDMPSAGNFVTQKLLNYEIKQRFLLWVFGMTVIGQLWLWPLYAVACSQSLAITVVLISYTIWIIWGPGRHAACNEAPFHAPWRHLPVWQLMGDYFNARVVKTAELDPQGRYLIAAYPHGISAISGWVCFATEAAGFSRLFPGIRPWCMTLASNFKCPGIREYCLMYGLRSCERRSCINMLQKPGAAIVIYPGGAAEALVTEQGKHKLILQRRKGFVRIALLTGASLVPAYGFGETDLFETYVPRPGSWLAKMQLLSHRYWGTSQPMFKGSGIFSDWGLLPLRRQLTTVVGAPIPVNKIDPKEDGQEAFDAAVEHLHAQYCDALQELFDAWKAKVAPECKADLVIAG